MKRFFAPAMVALWMAQTAAPAIAQNEASWQQRAPQELEQLFAALSSANSQTIERHLAPEFQIVRSNGATYDKTSYLQRSVPVIKSSPRFRNIKVTGQADIRVITFNLEVNETIDGHTVENLAPQLIVFRDLGDRWVVIASANLAKLSP